MSQTTIEVRQQNPDETEKMAQFESPDGEDVCASYVSRNVADQIGEFATLTVTEGDDANLQKTTTNYAVYETPGGAVTGLYIALENFDQDDVPESVGLTFDESDEESFEEAASEIEEEAEEEAESLLANSEESEEEEVEISDEELELVGE